MKDWTEHQNRVISCTRCPRLVHWREEIAKNRKRAYVNQEYWGKPVPGYGDIQGSVFVVGLAPGAHGSNRTGRMFTGDRSGDFLYQALYDCGFANQPYAKSSTDGLKLSDIYISAVCRCVPPLNKPTREEIQNCLPYLNYEMEHLASIRVIVALGKIAYDYTLQILTSTQYRLTKKPFAHGVKVVGNNGQPVVLGSYHPSQQNTQTGRLTYPMFLDVWRKVRKMIDENSWVEELK